MGTTNPFIGLFGKSPFKPLQHHMRIVAECAQQIPGLLEAVKAGDAQKVKAVAARIDELEHQADVLENEMRSRMHKSLFMPVDRRDLLELWELQDDIADRAQEIAGFVQLRPMEMPVGSGELVIAFARRCVDACDQAAKIQEELDELVETGFSGRETTRVMEMVVQLNQIESETDRMGRELAADLFRHEEETKAVSVVFWYQLIRWIGELADSAEKIGDRLRLLMAK